MAYAVTVTGVSPSTSKTQLHEFFTFCGQITDVEYEDKSGKAVITFQKASAAKTALMLHGGTLDSSTLSVTSDTVHQDEESHAHDASAPLNQEDKPRAGIAAEYLAKGYQLSDQVLARAIELDHQKGISAKFLNYVRQLDKSVGERALGPDQTVSGKVQTTVESAQHQAEQKGYIKAFHDYYTKAISTPIGQKVREFYTTTSKQILDIHEEARRIASEEKARQSGSPATPAN